MNNNEMNLMHLRLAVEDLVKVLAKIGEYHTKQYQQSPYRDQTAQFFEKFNQKIGDRDENTLG